MIQKATLLSTGTASTLLTVLPLVGLAVQRVTRALHEFTSPAQPSAAEIKEMGAWFETVSRAGSLPFSPIA
ncbi:MAG: hypothetical protein U0610_13430 [bacterium]